jgi:hypothetical protein
MQGGFCRYDLPNRISVLSINSILMNTKNDEVETESVKLQLEWLERQLLDNSASSYILHMHIPPGQWFQTGADTYWKENYLQSYMNVIAKY